MHYDPIKKEAARVFNCCRGGRILFYRFLDILLLRSWHIRREIRKWAACARPGSNVLDAGSGFGQYVYYISRLRGQHIIKGIDIKSEETDTGNRFFGKERPGSRVIFETADLNRFNEPDRYDLILCVDVLEHIEDDLLVMGNLCRSLRKGGLLLISTPSDRGGSDVHGEGDESFIGEHVRDGYGKDEISDKLLRAGFSRVDVRYSYGRPGQLSWRLSMKYPVKMINMSRLFFVLLPFYYMVIIPPSLVLNWLDLRGNHESGTGLVVAASK